MLDVHTVSCIRVVQTRYKQIMKNTFKLSNSKITAKRRHQVSLYLQLIFQVRVFKCELCFDPLAPPRFVVEVDVCALLKVVSSHLWLLVALKPCHVLLMISPAGSLELTSSLILGTCTLQNKQGTKHRMGNAVGSKALKKQT